MASRFILVSRLAGDSGRARRKRALDEVICRRRWNVECRIGPVEFGLTALISVLPSGNGL